MFSTSLLTAAILLGNAFAAPTLNRRATVCNGREELCGRSYGATTFLTAHNHFAFSSNPLALGRNQDVSVEAQMTEFGARALQGQAHDKDGVLHFCHSSCTLFDGGPVLDTFRVVKDFLDRPENAQEVMTLILTNPGNRSMKDVWQPIFQESGLESLVFTPPKSALRADEWPTLGELIDDGKRIIVFMDSGADTQAVPYILPQFDSMWEPPFSETDPSFPCRVDRNGGDIAPEDKMYMINHNLNAPLVSFNRRFLGGLVDSITDAVDNAVDKVTETVDKGTDAVEGILLPAFSEIETTNSIQSIVANADGCAAFANGRAPNFVLLDIIDKGEGKAAVDRLNGF